MKSGAPGARGRVQILSVKDFVVAYFSERAKVCEEMLRNAPSSSWIIDLLLEFHRTFVTTRSPLIRMGIIHFLNSHKELQKLGDKQNAIVDNFVALLDQEQKRQKSMVFRGIAAVSELVRKDSLCLMQAIDAMSSGDPDVVRAAGETLKLLCRQSKFFCKSVLTFVEMPHLLRFLPDMKHSRKLQSRAVARFVENMKKDCPYLNRVLRKSMLFVENLGWFHNELFDGYVGLLSEDPDVEVYCFCCDLISQYAKYLYPEQVGWLARSAVDFLHSVQLDPEHQAMPLKLLMNMSVTSPRLYDIEPGSLMNAGYLTSCFPREPNAKSGDLAVETYNKFIDGKLSKDAVALMFKNLSYFAPSLSDHSHSTLVDSLIPKLARVVTFQGPVADFLLTLPMELAPMYIIDTPQTSIARLRAALLRLHYLADVTANIEPKADLECGTALFRIGEYETAAKYFGAFQSNRRADAYKYLSLGLLAAGAQQYSRAVSMFQQARDAFDSLKFVHDFHDMYTHCLLLYYSICFQGNLLYQAYVDATGMDGINEHVMGTDKFMDLLCYLPNSSFLLHPDIDEVSRRLVLEFVDRGKALVAALGTDRQQFETLSKTPVITPPCLLSTDTPIYVENITVTKSNVDITQHTEQRIMFSVTGTIINKTDLKFTVSCEVDFTYEDQLHKSTVNKIPSNGDFEIPFPLLISSGHQWSYFQKLTLTFTAQTEDKSIYLIGYYYPAVQVATATGKL